MGKKEKNTGSYHQLVRLVSKGPQLEPMYIAKNSPVHAWMADFARSSVALFTVLGVIVLTLEIGDNSLQVKQPGVLRSQVYFHWLGAWPHLGIKENHPKTACPQSWVICNLTLRASNFIVIRVNCVYSALAVTSTHLSCQTTRSTYPPHTKVN